MPKRAPIHQPIPQRAEQARGTAAQRGYGYAWQQASESFLIANPLCRQCELEGRTTASEVTDHIVPHRGNTRLFWDPSNWQPLCRTCHGKKTAAGL